MKRSQLPPALSPAPAPVPDFVSQTVRKGDYYFLDLQPKSPHGLSVVCGGMEWCGEDYHIERETFPFYSLEFVLAGDGVAMIDGHRYELHAGDMFAYGPGIRHGIQSRGSMRKYFVDFTGTRAKALMESSPFARNEPLHFTETAPVEEIFQRLQQDGQQLRSRTRAIAALQVELLLLRAEELAVCQPEAESRAHATYQSCRQTIEEHCLSLKNTAMAARSCHISEPYLCRIFQEHHDCSPGRYLLQCKMQKAAALLLGGQLLVKEAANAIGFEDPYHFSKAFKRIYGMSPEQFREQRR